MPPLEFRLPTLFAEREAHLLAPYAMKSEQSAGRKYPEPLHSYRGPFQRDRDRVVHSAAYRRLNAKTQVFTGDMGDYHRTRLTHTHEVASVARTLGRALALNEDLIETLALVHDLGHPPFGHAGEDVLDECLQGAGGFCHNAQALRVVELLETRYPEFPGLNLSLEVLEGQQRRVDKHLPRTDSPLLEVQVVDAADSVAYDTHDADDALELGLLSLEELLETRLWSAAARRVRAKFSALTAEELRRAVLHELIDWQVGDLIARAIGRIATDRLDSTAAVQHVGPILIPTDELAVQKVELESFLFQRVYRHPDVLAGRTEAQGFLREMYVRLCEQPERLPERFRTRVAGEGLSRTVADYLAGMTDRFARREYDRIVD